MYRPTTPLPPLGEGAVHIWIFENSVLEPCRDALHRHLQPAERQEHRQFVTAQGRGLFSLYRGAFRRVLGWYEGCDPEQISLSRGIHGKPVHHIVPRDDGPDSGGGSDERERPIAARLNFNISHSHDYGVLAVTRRQQVGVDIERVRLPESSDSLMDHFFLPAEADIVRFSPVAERATNFCRIWTRKEAAVKSFGGSLAEWIGVLPVATAGFESVVRHEGLADFHFFEFDTLSGYLGCLCTMNSNPANITALRLTCEGWSFENIGWSLRDNGWGVSASTEIDGKDDSSEEYM